jgi:hypothetical protein
MVLRTLHVCQGQFVVREAMRMLRKRSFIFVLSVVLLLKWLSTRDDDAVI